MGFLSAKNDYRATALAPGQDGYNFQNYLPTANTGFNNAAAANTTATTTGASQNALAQALLDQAKGGGAVGDMVQQQLKDATARGQMQAAGQAASTRGLNPAQQARLILQNQALSGQQAAGQAANLKGQLALGSQTAAGNVLGQERSGDVAQVGAGTTLGGTAGGLQNTQNANLINESNNNQAINAGITNQNTANSNSLTGGLISGIAGAGASLLGAGAKKAHGGAIDAPMSKLASALVPGDSPKNDVVPAMLSPKEVVLPRSVTMAPDAPARAKAFMEHIMAKEKPTAEDEPHDMPKDGYARMLMKHKMLDSRIAKLEASVKGKK